MVEANPSGAAQAGQSGGGGSAAAQSNGNNPSRNLFISSNNFIHMNEGNIKNFYKISSCIGRGKQHSILSLFLLLSCLYTI